MVKLLARANYYYSILWIALTGTDKFQYREKSNVGHFLTWAACQFTLIKKSVFKI